MRKLSFSKKSIIIGIFTIIFGVTYYSFDLSKKENSLKIIYNEASAYVPVNYTAWSGVNGGGQYALALHEKPSCNTDFFVYYWQDGECSQ